MKRWKTACVAQRSAPGLPAPGPRRGARGWQRAREEGDCEFRSARCGAFWFPSERMTVARPNRGRPDPGGAFGHRGFRISRNL